MFKVILGIVLLCILVYWIVRGLQNREATALQRAEEKLASEKTRSKVLGVREETVDIQGQNVKREKRVDRKESKYDQ